MLVRNIAKIRAFSSPRTAVGDFKRPFPSRKSSSHFFAHSTTPKREAVYGGTLGAIRISFRGAAAF